MKKISTLLTALFLCFGMVQAQDVYFAGNSDGMGKIWKNNTLIYSIPDTVGINVADMKVANDSTLFYVGRTFSDLQSHVWMNDSVIFTADDNAEISRITLDANGWTAAGSNKVWQNGEILYAYTIDSTTVSNIYALAIDSITGDIYAGGSIVTPGVYACIWKNDTIFWQNNDWSAVKDLYFDREDLYASGFVYENESINGVVWQNGSIIFQIEEGGIMAITAFNGSLYWAGISAFDNTAYIWQDGEVIYSQPDCSGINAFCVNEYGVYYAGISDGIATIWKDGEILYQPEDCTSINSICVLPTLPTPVFNITVESDNPDWGTVSGGGSYPYGDTIQIEAHPNTGYDFLSWDDGDLNNPRDLVVTQDSTFVALFAISQFTINVVSDHPAWGYVTGGGTYYYGDTVVIAATANLGFEFISWDDDNTDNPRTIIVTEDQTYTARFRIQQCHIITEVTPEGAGTVNGGGTYDYGTSIHLTAHSHTGYVFDKWDDGNITNPRPILVDGDATYTAIFNILQYEITTECDPVEGGTVTGGGIYDYGTTTILKATPNENYTFLCWSDGIISNPRNITVTQNATYKALFHLNGTPQYTITVLANDPALGTVTGGGTYPQGTVIEISATPNSEAVFSGWDDGSTDNPRSVTVTQDMTFIAQFDTEVIETYTIIVRSENPLEGSAYGSGTYHLYDIINIVAVPAQGFSFSRWQDGNIDNPRTIIVTGDAEYVASFSQNQVQTYTVTVYYDESQGFILGAGTYNAGTTANIAAIPADGYYFKKWNDGTTDNPKEVLVDHDIVLAAFFDGTGVDENGITMVDLYPNPAKDKIRIEGLEGEHEIQIYNVYGMLIKTLSIDGNDEIDIEELSAGLYIIRIDGHTMKFMKE